MSKITRLRALLSSSKSAPWILGGCSGRMITTPDGYIGDGWIADVDTLVHANLVIESCNELPVILDIMDLLYDALKEQRDLTEDAVDGNYKPDSFTNQPADSALKLYEEWAK